MAKVKGIYRRGNIYWIRYMGLDGKMVFESSKSDKFRDAEALLIKRKQAIKEGNQPEIKKIPNYSFRELAERYMTWIQGRQNSAKVKGYIMGQLLSLYANIPLRRFSTSLIDQLQTDLINKGYKASSNNKVTNLIKHMFRKAVEWDMVEEEVLKRIRRVKPLKDDSKRLRYLSKEECQELIKHCTGNIKAIVITALNTGMRKGEILGLKWNQIDFRHGFILLDKTKNGERREIPINQTLRETLQALPRRLDVPYVFFDPATGKPYQDIKRSFNTAVRKAGIKDFHFHDLRHTFASHLVMAGVDIVTVSKLLGHKSLKMTLRYSHLAPAHLSEAVQILERQLQNSETIQKLYNPIKIGVSKECVTP
jgi:integrase